MPCIQEITGSAFAADLLLGALWSVGCLGCDSSRLSSVITQSKCAQNIGHYHHLFPEMRLAEPADSRAAEGAKSAWPGESRRRKNRERKHTDP